MHAVGVNADGFRESLALMSASARTGRLVGVPALAVARGLEAVHRDRLVVTERAW